ncbi:hypothetical protein [uncultured Vagococcus sp.]|uniref:hypothetical protein n=1 Tax=uncultured Vagococcus sp. TaxID=189676 RepID=UPI0028D73DAF|nr:hypothetical protein [uncultured Vagococcus sp.]
MKTRNEIKKLIEKHKDFYEHAKDYVHTYGLMVEDLFRVNDELRVTCKNLDNQPVYLKVENEELFKKVGSITKDWESVHIKTF